MPKSPSPEHVRTRARNRGGLYVQRCILFSLSGRWALQRNERRAIYNADRERCNAGICSQLRANWGTKEEPDEPPQGLTDQQVETCNRQLGKQGWQIVRGWTGRWGLVRIL